MLSRTLPIFLMFAVVACSSSEGSARSVERPAGAGTGVVVAWVHLIDGTARVRAANGFTFEVAPGSPLLRTDEVIAGAAGFVVLRLGNGYLVRIDEEISLRVADIYLLDAPPAPEKLEQQIDRLLTSKEREKGERIAGWHARLSAAETVAPLQATRLKKKDDRGDRDARKAERKLSTAEGEDLAPSTPTGKGPPGLEKAAPSPQPTAGRPAKSPPDDTGGAGQRTGATTQVASDERLPGGADQAKEAPGEAAPAEVWKTRIGGKLVTRTDPPPALLKMLLTSADLKSCLEALAARLPVELGSITIMLRIQKLRVQKVMLGGGLPVPGCLRKLVVHDPVPEMKQDGWLILEVPLR